MLYIGGIYGGPEVTGSPIDSALGRIMQLRGERPIENSGSLDIVFHVGGSLLGPDYEGVRTASFSKKRRLLQVQIGVRSGINAEQQTEIIRFLMNSFREAIRIAVPVFEKAKIPYRRAEYDLLLDRIEAGMSPH